MKSDLTYIKKHELFKELDSYKDGKFFAIIDYKVKNHLPQWISFSAYVFWLKNPEEEKNLDYYSRAVQFFLDQGISRSSTIYAIGGGATTDFAGFVSATLLRGLSWVAIPTTLLGMIDGSIGGKVAVNLPQGKNLLGAFHLPRKVFICTEFLTSLPELEWLSGKGEVLKYGFLSKEINQLIFKKAPIEEIILACGKYKNGVIENDFYEKGERIFLNLGHTLGHAFELSLKIPHGQAVGMGLKYIFRIMGDEKSSNLWSEMIKLLDLSPEKFDLKKFKNFDVEKFLSYIEQDKKKVQTSIRLVLVNDIGVCYVKEISIKELKEKIVEDADFKD